jgi:hypothetical protein
MTTQRRQTPPRQNAHLRAALRARRMLCLATQTPPIRVLPGPQPKAACVIALSGCGIGTGLIACADVATARAKPATAISLSIATLLSRLVRIAPTSCCPAARFGTLTRINDEHGPSAASRRPGRSRSFAKHSPSMLLAHFVGDARPSWAHDPAPRRRGPPSRGHETLGRNGYCTHRPSETIVMPR